MAQSKIHIQLCSVMFSLGAIQSMYSSIYVQLNLCTVQYSTVQYSTVQYSTVQYSTVQYSTVQFSTVQCSTIE